jgi:glycosyltransferase involved in cell wall biosynthesis
MMVQLPHVAILLCTMQGQHYLRDQLDSIIGQTYPGWSLWVSDDGSDDRTHAILASYQKRVEPRRLSTRSGPGRGFAANFLSLACSREINADYYAFADQDDVWESDKLVWALEWLHGIPSHVPALYCSRTLKVNEHDQALGLSELHLRPPSFANALVQNIASGNTMVFNHAACELLRKAGPDLDVAAHDWWLYLLVAGCGGRVHFDARPTVRYRQHSRNLIGTNHHWRERLLHTRALLKGQFRVWNDMNISALGKMRLYMTAPNRRRLDEFSGARGGNILSRLLAVRRAGVYRQTVWGNVGLLGSVVLNKM